MVGHTPTHIVATRPLSDGVVSDFEVTEQMLKYFIEKVHQESFTLFSPTCGDWDPSGVTEVEKRAVERRNHECGYSSGLAIENQWRRQSARGCQDPQEA
jgi:rod shape-determining protein MreB